MKFSKTFSKTIKNKNKTTTRKKKYGGEVIESGGFGCLMKPAIKCKANDKTTDKTGKDDSVENRVSKVMLKKYANQEYQIIMKILSVLSKIKNYQNYFLLDGIELCSPSKFTKTDLNNFDKKCKPLIKKGITSKNINTSKAIDKIRMLSMPNGGLDIGNFIEKYKSFYYLKILNKYLMDLLSNGIIKMNELGVYHFDLKDSNILVLKNEPNQSETEKEKELVLKTRIIDWGLSILYNHNTNITNIINNENNMTVLKNLPENMVNRPLQYNLPLSIILFNTFFVEMYDLFLTIYPIPTLKTINEFTKLFLQDFLENYGIGHYETIGEIFETIELFYFHKNKNITNKYTSNEIGNMYIVKYISSILFEYTKNGKFHMSQYITVFLENVDIYGFILSYYSLLEILKNNYDVLSNHELELFNKLCEFILFTMKTPSKPINTHSLIKKMKEIDNVYDEIIRTNNNTINSSSSSQSIRKSKSSSILEKLQNDILVKI